MEVRTRAHRKGLQSLLETLNPGDEIHVTHASRVTGLDEATCETVLDALARVDLYTRTADGVFVRRCLFDTLVAPHGRA